jgi:tetratricopeptide (TPR) repeat protein
VVVTSLRHLIGLMWRDGSWARLLTVLVAVLLLGLDPAPLSLIASLRRAEQALADGDYATAAEDYRLAIAYQPWVTAHRVAVAEAELLAGQSAAAARDLEYLAATQGLSAEQMLWLGAAYAGLGRDNDALRAWEQARAGGAANAESLATLAEVYLAREEWSRARETLQALAVLSPDDAELLYRLGLLQALEEREAAIGNLERAAELDASLADKATHMRQTLADLQADDDPAYTPAQLGLGYMEVEEWALAEEAFSRAVVLNPAYGEAVAYLGYTRGMMGASPLPAMQQALALSPDSPIVHYLAGLTWKQLGRWSQARAEFESAYDLDPQNPAIAVEIAGTHRAENQPQWAEIWLQEALRLAPGDSRFEMLLVQFYVDDEYRVEEVGLPMARRMVREQPENAEAHDALGWARFLLGDVDAADRELARALALDPELARAYYHIGTLREYQSRPQDAIEAYRQAARLDPDGAFGGRAVRALKRLGVPLEGP